MKKSSKEEMQNLKVLLFLATLIINVNMILLASFHPNALKSALSFAGGVILLTISICADKRKTHVTRGYVLTISAIYLVFSAVPFILSRDFRLLGIWAAEILIYTLVCILLLKKKKGEK